MPSLISNSVWTVRSIGIVSCQRTEPIDDDWDSYPCTITLVPPFDDRSIAGLDSFSHLEVIYVFDRVDPGYVYRGARVPRGNPDWPAVGIFAQRAKNRPNRLGLSTCELVSVTGSTVVVRGLDAIDGTPVVDIKPYMAEFGPRSPVRQPTWSHELMAGYY